MIKRFGLLLLLMVSVISTGSLTPALADDGAPAPVAVAVMENTTFDFGAVYEGVDVIHDFIIRNKGNADLEIIDVRTG